MRAKAGFMASDSVCFAIDGARGIHAFDEAMQGLADGKELVLDLSAVSRVTTDSIKALENLAAAAEAKPVKIVLRGVNVGVYKALKVGRLAPRFSFQT
jgi:anti-anti-sigma regulatory factor